MNEQEMWFILKQGEGQFVEFKEDFDKSLAKEIVAFANSQGGRIFLGISDKGEVKGVEVTNSLKSQIQDIARNCDPSIKINIKINNNILIVEVEEGSNKPYACSGGFYLRIGANSQKLSRDEIFDFSIQEGKIKFDEQINNDFNFKEDFDEKKLDHYVRLAKLTKNIGIEEIVLNLRLGKLFKNEIKFNNTGVLFFAKKPEKFFINSKVVCVTYQTNEKVNILDKKIFDNGIINNIQDAINYVKKHIDVKFEIKSAKRKEISQFPEEAYREAIVNAIMHRDYFDKSGDIIIEVFKNKLIVSNPGGLVKWLKPEDFGKYSRSRNQLIAELLSKTEYVEKVGSGINRIRIAMSELGLPSPIFDYNSSFSVTLLDENNKATPQATPQAGLTELEQKIVNLILKNNKISRYKLSKVLEISEDTVKEYIQKLKEKRVLERIGETSAGHWKVEEKYGNK